MEDNNNNLGDFFRKKLNELDDSDSSWTKPDQGVKEHVLGQITASPKPTNKYPRLFLIALIGLFSIAALGYIVFLRQQLDDTLASLNNQQEKTEKLDTYILELSKKHTNEKNELMLQNEQLIDANNKYAQQEKDVRHIIKQYEISVFYLQKEKQMLLDSMERYKTILLNEYAIRNSANTISEKGLPLIHIQKIPSLSLNLLESKPIEKPKIKRFIPKPPQKKKRKRFEVGYEYALQSIDIPFFRDFGSHQLLGKRHNNGPDYYAVHGINFAFSPKKNWWLRSGFRMSSVKLQREIDLALIYNQTNENIDSDGREYDLVPFITTTPYSVIQNDFQIFLEEGQELEDGDILEVTVKDGFFFKYWQIPLGLAYSFDFEKAQFLLGAGLQWNKISFKDYTFDLTSSVENQEIVVTPSVIEVTFIPKKQFISTHIGLELNHQLFKTWQVRAGIIYNYNFIKNKTIDFSNSTKLGTTFKLGLNYRF